MPEHNPCFQVFSGFVVPFCASYVFEARHRAIFAHQLRNQLRAASGAGASGTSPSAPASTDARTLNSMGIELPRTDAASQQHRCTDEVDEQPAPVLVDLIFAGGWLPVVSVLMWHVICRVLLR